ncbi:hypothetical protein B0H13DRAFT_1902809 [Mycena leptocephala]|nr:hypothetical protein B0H13DRAFT_1902809 [Mycena leptocephala]
MKGKNAKEIYTRLILGKGTYGYPLWNGEPATWPVEHYTEGVQVGDVGSVTSEGAFEYLFTIAAPKDDPRNDRIKDSDDPFEYMKWDSRRDISTRSGFHSGYSESTESTHGKDVNASAQVSVPPAVAMNSGIQISFSSKGGVAFVLPNGATSFNHIFLDRILKHASANGLAWLESMAKLGRRGDLYLITGCHKASAWGITVSAEQSQQAGITMQLLVQENGGNIGYSWHASHTSHTSVLGPRSPRPKEEKDKENQCIFIRGYKIAKKEEKRWTPWSKSPEQKLEIDAVEGYKETKSALDGVNKSPKTSGGVDGPGGGSSGGGGPPGGSGGTGSSGGSTGGGGPPGGSAGGSGSPGDGAGGSVGGGGPSGVSAESSGGSKRPANNPLSDGGPVDMDSAISVEKIAGTSEAPEAKFAIVHDQEWMGVMRPVRRLFLIYR